MRNFAFAMLLLSSSSIFAANCAEVAATLNRNLNPGINVAELTDVLNNLNQRGQLPAKFVSKRQATAAGWRPGSNLWTAQPGKSIGGDRFGNYEKQLPRGQYTEADLDYQGGKRGAKRIVFSRDQRFVTVDHYQTFREIPACH